MTKLTKIFDSLDGIPVYWIVKGVPSPDMIEEYNDTHPNSPITEDTIEWQFSDGPAGQRGSSYDYLSLEDGIRELSPACFVWDDSNVEEDQNDPDTST